MKHAETSEMKRPSYLRALVVDDEEEARRSMSAMLSRIAGVTVVGEAACVMDALQQLKSCETDVIFLDVNMPDLDGLTLARALQKLPEPPAIVFASAHSEYAIEAFDVQAIDYLVKPVHVERLAVAVNRTRNHILMQASYRKPSRIPVENGGKKLFIPIDDIRFAVAHNDYAYIQTEIDRYFVFSSLARLEKNLGKYGFCRVHRSFLVNLECVREIESGKGGALSLSLDGIGDKIPVSRRRAHQVKSVLGM